MNRKRGAALAAALVIAVLLIRASVMPSGAQPAPPPIATELLSGRAVFTDDVDLKLKIKLDGQATAVVHARILRPRWWAGSLCSPEPSSHGTPTAAR